MDPLSVIASVLTLAEAATQISKAISRLRHFGELPGKIYAIKNEVSDLETLLRQISHALKQDSLETDGTYQSLEHVLAHTKTRLTDLANALERIANAFSGPKIKVIGKSAIWLKEKEVFQNFRDDISSIKTNLILMLSALTSQNFQHVVLELERITVWNSKSEHTNESIQEINNSQLALSTLVNQQHEVLSSRIDALQQTLFSQSLQSTPRLLIDQTLPNLDKAKATDTQKLSLVASRSSPCRTWCPCTCHSKRKLNLTTPRLIQGVVGRMFVGHSGPPLLQGRCNFRGCQHRRKASTTVEYWFPAWFVPMNIKFSYSYLPRIGPEFLLLTTTRVADDSQSITFAMEGNIGGLEHLFRSGLAGPRDVSDSRGFTLMRWALYGGMHNYEMVKFLIREGATVDETSYDNVWDFILRGKCTEMQQNQLRCITDGGSADWIEEQNFPLVHRIVLGLSSKPLIAELDENPHAAAITDSQNRSALDWATARAQLEDMAVLLRYGADPNNMDATGRTPVLHAVDSHDIRSLRLILESGGNPNPTYPKGMFRSSPLTAAGFAGMPALLKLLLDFEADPNACNPEGLTALHSIARTHNVECALILLEYGADLNAMSSHGRTPLTTAIIHNNHPVLQVFTDRCWEYMTVPQFNVPEILPAIAEFADVETMRILSSVHPLKLWYDISFDSLNTNQTLLEQRCDYNDELRETFDALIAAAKDGSESVKSPDSVLESSFFSSARSSFHSELASAVLKLQSMDVSPLDFQNVDLGEWPDSEEVFYSPISLTSRHPLSWSMSPITREPNILSIPPVSEHSDFAATNPIPEK